MFVSGRQKRPGFFCPLPRLVGLLFLLLGIHRRNILRRILLPGIWDEGSMWPNGGLSLQQPQFVKLALKILDRLLMAIGHEVGAAYPNTSDQDYAGDDQHFGGYGFQWKAPRFGYRWLLSCQYFLHQRNREPLYGDLVSHCAEFLQLKLWKSWSWLYRLHLSQRRRAFPRTIPLGGELFQWESLKNVPNDSKIKQDFWYKINIILHYITFILNNRTYLALDIKSVRFVCKVG